MPVLHNFLCRDTCTRMWNKMYPLVTSVSTAQRWWKEAIFSYIKDTVGTNAGQKAAKGGILRFIFIGKHVCCSFVGKY